MRSSQKGIRGTAQNGPSVPDSPVNDSSVLSSIGELTVNENGSSIY